MKLRPAICQCFALLALTVCAPSTGAQETTASVPTFTLAVTAPSSPYKLGDSIRLRVKLTNVSDHMIYIPVPPGPEWGDRVYNFKLTDSAGIPITKWRDLMPPKNELKHGSSRTEFVKPTEVLDQEVSLEKTFKITSAGRYTLRVSLWDYSAKTVVGSNEVTIEVVPSS